MLLGLHYKGSSLHHSTVSVPALRSSFVVKATIKGARSLVRKAPGSVLATSYLSAISTIHRLFARKKLSGLTPG